MAACFLEEVLVGECPGGRLDLGKTGGVSPLREIGEEFVG